MAASRRRPVPLRGNGRNGIEGGVWQTLPRHQPPPSPIVRIIVFSGVAIFLAGLLLLLASLYSATLAVSTAYAAASSDLPVDADLSYEKSFKTAQIFDRHGRLLYEIYNPDGGKRTIVPLHDISQYMIDATLAAEDVNFYANPGVDPRGILRAFIQHTSDSGISGASTITQQLVRNLFMTPEERYERTLLRKAKEAILAIQVTQRYPKDKILEMYLNEVYYGYMSYGVEAAAQTYFGKHARDLTLAEAAMLAGLPQAPSRYDPIQQPRAARQRQAYVLDQMAKHGFITREDAEKASRERLVFNRQDIPMRAPHWVMYIRSLVEEKYGPEMLYTGGLKIYTTLDADLNDMVLDVMRNNLPLVQQRGASNEAVIVIDPKTGQILAYQGSVDYWDTSIDGQVDILQSERQPGSSIKPVVYYTAFREGWGPYTYVDDSPHCWVNVAGTSWCPVDFDFVFRGRMTVRQALGNSLNVPAVLALDFATVPKVKDVARSLGITTWDDKPHLGLSLTLGGAEVKPIELAGAYATFANYGRRIPLNPILRIEDAWGRVLEEYQQPEGEQVLEPGPAFQVLSILADPFSKLVFFGRQTPIVLDRPAAAKTGTTDNFRDIWTMGFTPNLLTGVWVGNADGRPMGYILSSQSAGKIWREVMDMALDYLKLPPEEFPPPPGVEILTFCADAHLRPGAPACYPEVFLSDRAPPGLTPWTKPTPWQPQGLQPWETLPYTPPGQAPQAQSQRPRQP